MYRNTRGMGLQLQQWWSESLTVVAFEIERSFITVSLCLSLSLTLTVTVTLYSLVSVGRESHSDFREYGIQVKALLLVATYILPT